MAFAQDWSTRTTADSLDAAADAPQRGATTELDIADADTTVTTIGEELDAVPGVARRGSGGIGDREFATIRGSTSEQVSVFLDGIPLTGGSQPAFDLSLLPVDVLREIVVHRSVVPVQLGSPTPGGAIDLRPGFSSDERTRLSVSAGSFGARRAALSTQHAPERGELLVSTRYAGSNGDFSFFDDNGTPFNTADDTPNRTRRNAEYDEVAALALYRARPHRWRLTTTGLATWKRGGAPGIAVAPALRTSETRWRVLVGGRAERRRLWNDRLDIDLVNSTSVRGQAFEDPEGELTYVPVSRRDLSVGTLHSVRPTIYVSDALSLRLVAEARTEQLRASDDELAADAFRATISAGAALEGHVVDGLLSAEIGLRFDQLVNQAEGSVATGPFAFDDDPSLINPHVGVAVVPPLGEAVQLRAFATASIAQRAPSFLELYGSGGAVVGNPSLVPEKRRGWDAGVDLRARSRLMRISLEYAFFDARMDDNIVFVENGAGATTPRNLSSTAQRGHELAASVAVESWFGMRGSYTLLDALDRTRGDTFNNRLPFRSVHAARLLAWVGWEPVSVRWATDAQSSFFVDRANARERPTRITHDAGVRLDGAAMRGLVVDLSMRNLTDVRTGEVTLPDGDVARSVEKPISDFVGFPLPGRSVFLTIAYTVPRPDHREESSR